MIGAASPEEREFAVKVNAALAPLSIKVSPFEMAHKDETRQFCLTVQLGTRRHLIKSEQPFHYDSVDDVVNQVRDWYERTQHQRRWTTSLEDADTDFIQEMN